MDNKHNKQQTEMRYSKHGIILLTMVIASFTGIILISLIRSNTNNLFPPAKQEITNKKALQWLNAVKNNESKRAILLAKSIIYDDNPSMPQYDYIQLLMQMNISTLILTSPFNNFDFMRWHDAYIMKKIVNSQDIIKVKEESRLEALFNKMQRKIKLLTKSKKKYIPSPSIAGIWHKKTASTRELCRLYAALARQAGYDVQIVSLYTPKHVLKHLFCEIRKNKRSYIADPRFNVFSADASAALWAGETKSIPDAWPANIANCLNIRLYEFPAEAADYKLFNQQLHNKLRLKIPKSLPIFADDPEKAIDHYIKKYNYKNKNTVFRYWTFPFNSLQSSSDFPKDWRIQRKSNNLNK